MKTKQKKYITTIEHINYGYLLNEAKCFLSGSCILKQWEKWFVFAFQQQNKDLVSKKGFDELGIAFHYYFAFILFIYFFSSSLLQLMLEFIKL